MKQRRNMSTHGLVQETEFGTIAWISYIRTVEVWVWRGPEQKLLGSINTANGYDFCGTLDPKLGVGSAVFVTAGSEDECVVKMVCKWRELADERARREAV